jgi:GTPase SAR1 family protein
LVVFDLNNRETFDNLQKGWMKDISKYSASNVSIILVGNKCDTTQDRAVSLEDAKVRATRASCD